MFRNYNEMTASALRTKKAIGTHKFLKGTLISYYSRGAEAG